MIKNNKNVFLNYYDFKANEGRLYECLNTTIMTLFNEVYEYVDFTIDTIVGTYEGNILDLYNDLFMLEYDGIQQIYEYYVTEDMHEYKLSRIRIMIRCLMELVNNKFGKCALYEYLKFCLDILDFTHSSDSEHHITRTYQFDVLEMKSKHIIKDEYKATTIVFRRDGSSGYIQNVTK